MSFTQEDATAFLDANDAHINRLRKTITNLTTTQQVLYYVERLEKLELEDPASATNDWMMEVEAFLTAIAVSYGRLFSESKGSRVLKKKLIPQDFLDTHDQVIGLRNERYAHHGDHETMAAELELFVYERDVHTALHWRAGLPNGAPSGWKELFLWMDNFLKSSFQKQMKHLSETSGKNWVAFEPDIAFKKAHLNDSEKAGLPPLMDHISKLNDST